MLETGRLSAFLAVLIAGCLLLSWDAAPRTFEIYLKRSVVHGRDALTLADIVLASSDKPAAVDLAAIRLDVTPDRMAVIGTSYIHELLRPYDTGRFIIVGRGTTIIPASLLAEGSIGFFEELGGFLFSSINVPQARIEPEWTGPLGIPESRTADCVFDLRFDGRRDGVQSGPAVLGYRSRDPRSGWSGEAGLVLHVYAPVAVPKASLKPGERFQDIDLMVRTVDLAQYSENLLFPDLLPGVMTASQLLPAGEPIPIKKIARALFVKTGDRVILTFLKKNITISRSGRALGSGSIDDQVTVKPEGGDRRFQGLVTGDREVLVELP
jgi:flagella basal body P-ring formation protein FlgA